MAKGILLLFLAVLLAWSDESRGQMQATENSPIATTEGRFNNTTIVTDETNGIRLVGGEFYGCVELFDNVTQQWGPVRGWSVEHLEVTYRMRLADLACRNLGFSGVLATMAYRLSNGVISRNRWNTVENYYLNYYYIDIANVRTYPSTAPKFITPRAGQIHASLHDAVDRIVRGPCGSSDYECGDRYGLRTMCLACAGQRNQDDSPAIRAQVTCTSNYIRVSFPRPVDNSIQLEDVQLAAPPCSADQNSTHIYIDAPLTDCGTSRQDTEDDIIYSNTLTIYVNASSMIITRHHFTEISVECRLPRRKTVTVNFDPQNSSVFRSHIVGRGEFIISMELYLSNSFRSPVSVYPLSAELGQMLYVQLKVTSGDTNLQLFVDSCMATPTEQPDDSNVLYHLIRDGCDQDSTVARYWSPSTMQERFGFQAFAFTSGARTVYLHCDVLLCNAADPNSRCAQGCQAGRRRREAADDSDVYRLIQGPIVLKDDQTVRDGAPAGHTVNMVSLFMGACAVVVTAMLIG
ncbi:ZP domain-containing protein-like isoform X2 [Branchiostoma floridae x Branchiostoma belcheri]